MARHCAIGRQDKSKLLDHDRINTGNDNCARVERLPPCAFFSPFFSINDYKNVLLSHSSGRRRPQERVNTASAEAHPRSRQARRFC